MRVKASSNFPGFFETIANVSAREEADPQSRFRSLVRELEKLHRELARIINLNVGDTDWSTPTLTNSWVNTGGSFANAGYMKFAQDFVIFRGAIESGTIGSAAFTLPAGYRPASTLEFVVDHNTNFGELTVNSSGEVIPETNPNTVYYLDGVIFRADG